MDYFTCEIQMIFFCYTDFGYKLCPEGNNWSGGGGEAAPSRERQVIDHVGSSKLVQTRAINK